MLLKIQKKWTLWGMATLALICVFFLYKSGSQTSPCLLISRTIMRYRSDGRPRNTPCTPLIFLCATTHAEWVRRFRSQPAYEAWGFRSCVSDVKCRTSCVCCHYSTVTVLQLELHSLNIFMDLMEKFTFAYSLHQCQISVFLCLSNICSHKAQQNVRK